MPESSAYVLDELLDRLSVLLQDSSSQKTRIKNEVAKATIFGIWIAVVLFGCLSPSRTQPFNHGQFSYKYMNHERAEELLLVLLGICMLSYAMPFSLARNLLVSVAVACILVALLLLRSIAWHGGSTTVFDGVLMGGLFLSVVHLFSLMALQQTLLSVIVLFLFAAFYFMMAFFMHEHHRIVSSHIRSSHSQYLVGDYGPRGSSSQHSSLHAQSLQTQTQTHRVAVHDSSANRHADEAVLDDADSDRHAGKHAGHGRHVMHPPFPSRHSSLAQSGQSRDRFMRGIEPIPERAPPPVHKRTMFRSLFRRGVTPLQEVAPPVAGKQHDASFRRGMTPIKESPPAFEHVHLLETYGSDGQDAAQYPSRNHSKYSGAKNVASTFSRRTK